MSANGMNETAGRWVRGLPMRVGPGWAFPPAGLDACYQAVLQEASQIPYLEWLATNW